MRAAVGRAPLVGELRLVHLNCGPSCGQRTVGPCRSEGFAVGEHVPDGLGEFAGDFDAGDLLAALASESGCGALVVGSVGRMARRVDGRFDEGPAQVFGSVLGERSAVVFGSGLVDAWAQAGVAAELLVAKRVMSPISDAMVKPSTQAIPGMLCSSVT